MKTLLEIALSQYGQKEIEGSRDNQTIVGYAKEAGHSWVNDDETPWCSIFMDWCAIMAGVERTRKANARSWLEVGEKVDVPQTGDVVVFSRGNNPRSGHVGIYIAHHIIEDGKTNFIYVLGGNQSNQVKISLYDGMKVLGFRRLRKVA